MAGGLKLPQHANITLLELRCKFCGRGCQPVGPGFHADELGSVWQRAFLNRSTDHYGNSIRWSAPSLPPTTAFPPEGSTAMV